MNKPDGIIETNHLMELTDNTEYSNYIYKSLKNLYGICHNEIVIDDRTGQIIEKGTKEYDGLE